VIASISIRIACDLSPIATPFVPGVYTLAVSDEWGQAAVLHFTVKS
jgi:hypothetical protein